MNTLSETFPYDKCSGNALGLYYHYDKNEDVAYSSIGKPGAMPASLFLMLADDMGFSNSVIANYFCMAQIPLESVEHISQLRETVSGFLSENRELNDSFRDMRISYLFCRALVCVNPIPSFWSLAAPEEFCKYVRGDIYRRQSTASSDLLEDVIRLACEMFKNAGVEITEASLVCVPGYIPPLFVDREASNF